MRRKDIIIIEWSVNENCGRIIIERCVIDERCMNEKGYDLCDHLYMLRTTMRLGISHSDNKDTTVQTYKSNTSLFFIMFSKIFANCIFRVLLYTLKAYLSQTRRKKKRNNGIDSRTLP